MAGFVALVVATGAFLMARSYGQRGWAWAWAIGTWLAVTLVVYELTYVG